ncbi:MAG TPA: cytochrome P450, partial [Crinalium sp.]
MKSLPGPNTPSWLQRIQWIVNPVSYMEKAAADYPEMFESRVIGGKASLVFVNDPQGIQQILTGDRQEFVASGDENQILKPLLGDYSVVMLNGDRHRRRRQLLMPPFHGDRMRTYAELIVNLTHKAVAQLQPGTVFIARSVMQEISLQVILQTVFGLYDGDRCQQLKHV